MHFRLSVLVLLIAGSPLRAQDVQPDPPVATERIEVVATAPVDAVGLERDDVPANVVTVARRPGSTTGDAIEASVAALQSNDVQHNPMQRDVQLRGFTASPLLGMPQGLAVYADGARMNEAFGDVVNWDLLPEAAIDGIEVLPGSNPLFGLNALGGVLAVRTKSGRTSPGTLVSLTTTSLGFATIEGSTGFGDESWDAFVAASAAHDEGWRDFSRSRFAQLFAKGGLVRTPAILEASIALSDSRLRGNGPAPAALLEEERNAVFTHPDITANRAAALNARGEWHLREGSIAVVNAHARRVTTKRFNGDDSPFEPCPDDPSVLCEEDSSDAIVARDGSLIPSLFGDSAADAVNNTSDTRSDTMIVTAQLHRAFATGAIRHQLLGGITAESSASRFASAVTIASLTPERGTVGHGIEVLDDAVRLRTTSRLIAAHARDALELGRTSVIVAMRHQRATLDLDDRLGDALNGRHEFQRTNASIGATHELSRRLTLFASAGEASRAPTAVEVTCADPEDPCRLPNAFVSDPPLRQVVTRTFELGLRGQTRAMRWSTSAFDARNRDDILFIASGTTQGEGYFSNIGSTRRRGFELAASSPASSRIAWHASYAFLDATFRNAVAMPSRNHPLAEEGEIDVSPGDRIPGLSRQIVKGSVTVPILQTVRVSVAGRYRSSQIVRGDEANLLAPIAGFTTWDAAFAWELGRTEIIATAENVLDRRYATFGVLADAEDVLGDDYDDPLFISPGAPRSFRVLLSWRM